jgi:hypothetical protein
MQSLSLNTLLNEGLIKKLKDYLNGYKCGIKAAFNKVPFGRHYRTNFSSCYLAAYKVGYDVELRRSEVREEKSLRMTPKPKRVGQQVKPQKTSDDIEIDTPSVIREYVRGFNTAGTTLNIQSAAELRTREQSQHYIEGYAFHLSKLLTEQQMERLSFNLILNKNLIFKLDNYTRAYHTAKEAAKLNRPYRKHQNSDVHPFYLLAYLIGYYDVLLKKELEAKEVKEKELETELVELIDEADTIAPKQRAKKRPHSNDEADSEASDKEPEKKKPRLAMQDSRKNGLPSQRDAVPGKYSLRLFKKPSPSEADLDASAALVALGEMDQDVLPAVTTRKSKGR